MLKDNAAPVKLANMDLFRQQAFIGGEWSDADSGGTFEIHNPATGATIGTVPDMGAAETQRAIDAADAALPEWRAMLAKERSNIIRKWFELIRDNAEDLAVLLTTEQGKPLAESRSEVGGTANFTEWAAEEARRTYGNTIPTHREDARILVIKQPVGVCAAVTPWNFPSSMITRKVAPALAAGCTIVLKPAEQTPYSALALAVLAEQAGIPKGVFSVVTGSDPAKIGSTLTASKVVRKLSFTGSTAVGKLLMRECADTVKKVSLELGGHAPFIVFDDADIDAAIEGVLASKYRNAGQTCICANRIMVQDGIYDEFVKKFAERVKKMKVGSGMDDGIEQGPMIDNDAIAKVEEHISDAVEKGGEVVVGGKRHELGGTFFEPTVINNATFDMKIAREETFGPVAPIFRFKTDDEAVTHANDTEYGLAAYFYTKDLSRSFRVSEALEYGMVGVNSALLATEVAPFGGIKESGIGREGSLYGIDEFVEIKFVLMGGV